VFCHLSLEANDKYLQDIIRVLKPNGKALLFYADEIGLQKFYNDPNIKAESIFGQFNNYVETMNMMNRYPIVAKRVLDFKDSLILVEKL
jgi:SAM-dependent methyltransferase